MFVWTISKIISNMGYVELTSRSPGQILENSCLHSRGNISHRIFINFGRNVRLDNILEKFEYGSYRVKN